MNKSKVCVKLTRKNCKKVYSILKMFGEPIWKYSRLNKGRFDGKYAFAMIGVCDEEWLISSTPDAKTVVKPRELRNILFREHLKKGDVVALKYVDENEVWITKVESISEHEIVFGIGMTPCDGYRDFSTTTETLDELNFLRYATDEEKALLEPKTTIVTLNPVDTFTGSIPGQATYTREVWVNHYTDREFYVHYDEQSAYISIGRRGEGTTVKGTLTYDIPMTKV